MEAGDEAAAINLSRTAGPVAEPDNVGAVLAEANRESEPLRVEGEGDKPGLSVAVIAHEDRELAGGLQSAGTVPNELAVAAEERLQGWSAGEVAGIVGVELLPPVGRVCPDEVERLGVRKPLRVAGVNPAVDVPIQTGDAEFLAYVGACPAAAHGVQDQAGAEVEEQVLDEIAAAVAGVAPVAVLPSDVEVIQTGQVGDRTGVLRCLRQLGVYDLPVLRIGLQLERGYDSFEASGQEGIDDKLLHSDLLFSCGCRNVGPDPFLNGGLRGLFESDRGQGRKIAGLGLGEALHDDVPECVQSFFGNCPLRFVGCLLALVDAGQVAAIGFPAEIAGIDNDDAGVAGTLGFHLVRAAKVRQ